MVKYNFNHTAVNFAKGAKTHVNTMIITHITYFEPNMSQPSGEREQLEQSGFIVQEYKQDRTGHYSLNTLSGILDSYDEACEWIDDNCL